VIPRKSSRRVASGLSRTALALGAAGALSLALAGTAFAHVTVQPGSAEKGSYAAVSFRVPNEKPNSGTVKVEVTLPADKPITSVRTEPIAGWTAQVVKGPLPAPVERDGAQITEAVRTITWTANPGNRLNPNEFLDFTAGLGRLPEDADQLVLPAAQTYDDGTVVRWDQSPGPDGEEPERPAPVLVLTESTGEGHGGGAHGQAAGGSGGGHGGGAMAGTDKTARWLGGAGLLIGALGLGVGVGAVARTRRSRT
jgi:uncharacterized protein YcnI